MPHPHSVVFAMNKLSLFSDYPCNLFVRFWTWRDWFIIIIIGADSRWLLFTIKDFRGFDFPFNFYLLFLRATVIWIRLWKVMSLCPLQFDVSRQDSNVHSKSSSNVLVYLEGYLKASKRLVVWEDRFEWIASSHSYSLSK